MVVVCPGSSFVIYLLGARYLLSSAFLAAEQKVLGLNSLAFNVVRVVRSTTLQELTNVVTIPCCKQKIRRRENVLIIIFVRYLSMLISLYMAIITFLSTLLAQLIKSASAVLHCLLRGTSRRFKKMDSS